MTEKRFTLGYEDDFLRWIRDNLNQKNYVVRIGFGEEDNLQDVCDLLNQLNNENEQLKQQKPFLKIHNDYFIKYGDDKELFNLHKPSDIRSLCYLINRENGYDELECEYNEEGYGND